MSDFDIIVPVYGAIPHLLKCLWPLAGYSVIVVDDGSEEQGQLNTIARKYSNVRMYHHAENRGFIEACHTGMARSKAERVLFLNSDVIPSREAIEGMLAVDAAVVGCRLLFPNGRIQHAGVARDIQGAPYHPFMHLHAETPHAQRVMEVNAVTGAAFMVRRAIWDKLGGFDRAYSPGVFEDVDFCWKVVEIGEKVVYNGGAWMIHHMHGSRQKDKPYMHDTAQANLQRLMTRFALETDEALFYGNIS